MPTTGVYRGATAEERQAERRARLLDAGLELVGTSGWQAATVRAVCARARLTTRYFYESFESRDALLLALFDAITEEAAARVLAAVAAASDEAQAKSRAAVGAFVDLLVEDPRKARVAFSEAQGHELLVRRRRDGLRLFARLMAEQARAFYGAGADADLVDVTAIMLAGGMAELFVAWLDGEVSATRDELVEDCAALLAATGEAASAIARRRAAAGEG
ncbi:MAG TPA: TetR family transcriptional regulator [Conexibacter sp.]|nr:TetR family transcriptional regulator [Conexibacter sp.]